MKILVWIVASLVLYRFAEDFTHKKTDGFTLFRIFADITSNEAFETAPPETIAPLNQTFTYLGSGKQSFVFLSADGKYVLKFFKHARPFPPQWVSTLPFAEKFKSLRASKLSRKQEKRRRDFIGYKAAFDHFREKTGLLYVHINKTDKICPTIKIIDKIGIAHTVNLDEMSFALQKKARPFFSLLKSLEKAGNETQIKSSLQSVFRFCRERAAAGLYDDDPSLYKNFGVIDGEIVQIDPGQYLFSPSMADPENIESDVTRIHRKFSKYLKKHSPELFPYVVETSPLL